MSSEKFGSLLRIAKFQIRLSLLNNVIIAALMLVAVVAVTGVSYLDSHTVAVALERFAAWIGLVLIAPAYMPEEHGGIQEVIAARRWPFHAIILIRIVLSVLACFTLMLALACIMHVAGGDFDVAGYAFGGFATAFLLGAFGFMAAGLSRNTIAGLLLSVACFYASAKAIPAGSIAFPFSLSAHIGEDGRYDSKYFIVLIGCLFVCATFAVRIADDKKRGMAR
ncbi:MAG: hypothetical protein LBO70_01005 [Clostridiales Family XIII bacterium]|jgi:hypothetical protein|nr:hypothetical protein [Clostridiales Family XIII bacterium]